MSPEKRGFCFSKIKDLPGAVGLFFQKRWNSCGKRDLNKKWNLIHGLRQQVCLSPLGHRLLRASGFGLGVSLCLFYLMSYLISGGHELNRSDEGDSFIEFIRLKKEDFVQERKRQLPKKPTKTKKPPPPKKMAIAADKPSHPQMKMNPSLNIKGALKGSGPSLGPGGGGTAGSGVIPIVRIEPQYPRKAALQGIQGWVRLRFDITALGTVDNVKVLDSNPKRVFDMAAKRALYKWKYKPRINDEGRPVAQPGEMVQLDFKLEE